MSRRLVITGVAAAAVLGAVAPSFAQLPVTVQRDTHDGVFVGVDVNGEPGAGVRVSPNGSVCAGLGEDIPVCTPPVGVAVGPSRSQNAPAQSLPVVTVRHDSNGTAVGVGDVGVIIDNQGTICPVVSTQDWRCIHTGG